MFKQHIVDTPEPHLYMFRLTFDQLPVVQSAGQGMCVLQEERDSGLGMCSQSLGCRASRSSALTAWVQSTVLLVRPKLPQLAEHLCHSPTHHLHTHTHGHKEGTFLQFKWHNCGRKRTIYQWVQLYRPQAYNVHVGFFGASKNIIE